MSRARLGRASCLVLSTAVIALVGAGCGGPDDTEAPQDLGTDSSAQSSGSVALSGFQLSSASIPAGGAILATVTLNGAAKSASGGVVVYINFPRDVLAGPRFVRVPNGARSVTFTLHTNPYSAPKSASLYANTSSPQPSVFVFQTLAVTAPASPPATARPNVTSITLSPATVLDGQSSTATVTIGVPAPAGGAAVQLANSNDFLHFDADLPPVVVVPAGATSATFTVRSHLSSSLATSAQAIIVGNYFGGPFQGAYLTIQR